MARRFLTLPLWTLVSETVHTSITINDTLCVQVWLYFIHRFSRLTILPITISFNTSLSYCSTLDSSHAPSPWVSVEVLLFVRGLTIWVYNRRNKLSITIIFIRLERLIIDAMSGGVGVCVLPSWRQQGGCRGQPISAGLARDLCVLCCAIWWEAAPIDPFLHPMQVRSQDRKSVV